eukprot:CAMPEP_0171164442 /NCGR_PEP_ID=MMETSP0790-20130122/5671_1 /TAXON_ID=2925 /ORGANISM="Alexandrium catenella, Strain OF101" /LENGTH=398 /DNA_ID=CAMNT_0011629199 /DNA_START=8 /DNA_END=1204 /DNA_ORIENTATION=-
MGATCTGCASEDVSTCLPDSSASCECLLDEPRWVRMHLRVGCCAGPLDAPIQFAFARGNSLPLDVNLTWTQCPPDAGAAMSMLSAGLIDMAVMCTEDAVAFAAEDNPLRICGTFVTSPRVWGVYTGSGSSTHTGTDLRSQTLGVPNDRGASLTISVLGHQPSCEAVMSCRTRSFESVQHAADALRKGSICAAVWEQGAARHLVASGEWDLVCQVALPWPSLVLVASREALYAKARAVGHFVDFARAACEDFRSARGEAAEFVSAHYGLSHAETCDLLSQTAWACERRVDPRAVRRSIEHLWRAGFLDGGHACNPARLFARETSPAVHTGILEAPRGSPAGAEGDEPSSADEEEPAAEPKMVEPMAAGRTTAEPAASTLCQEDAAHSGLCQEHSPIPAG